VTEAAATETRRRAVEARSAARRKKPHLRITQAPPPSWAVYGGLQLIPDRGPSWACRIACSARYGSTAGSNRTFPAGRRETCAWSSEGRAKKTITARAIRPGFPSEAGSPISAPFLARAAGNRRRSVPSPTPCFLAIVLDAVRVAAPSTGTARRGNPALAARHGGPLRDGCRELRGNLRAVDRAFFPGARPARGPACVRFHQASRSCSRTQAKHEQQSSRCGPSCSIHVSQWDTTRTLRRAAAAPARLSPPRSGRTCRAPTRRQLRNFPRQGVVAELGRAAAALSRRSLFR